MPSETIYMDADKWSYLDDMVENDAGINNRSQAVQYLVRAEMQRDIIEDQQ